MSPAGASPRRPRRPPPPRRRRRRSRGRPGPRRSRPPRRPPSRWKPCSPAPAGRAAPPGSKKAPPMPRPRARPIFACSCRTCASSSPMRCMRGWSGRRPC
ncbi:MAG: hypothetical protein CML46_15520 [Rhodobacteraceae bacterium]|nr:hypothetical protein [Paracoccaceae bacterium]MBR28333.1 hypothetical protein [Paracoccaceae bacterium]